MMRKARIFLSALLVVSLVLSGFGGRLPKASAVTSMAIDSYPVFLPKDASVVATADGTPVAFHFSLTGGVPSQQYKLGSWLYDGTNSKAFFYNAGTATWVAGGSSTTSYPIMTADGAGSLSGWVQFRVDKASITNGTDTLRARLYPQPSGSTISPTYPTVTLMDMTAGTGTGGWITGTAYLADHTIAAQGKIVVVKSGATIIGTYVTEDNSVNEGVPSAAGTFSVAAPVGTGYSVEIWDPATNVITGAETAGVSVTAGGTTAGVVINGAGAATVPGAPTGLTATDGLGQIALAWSAPASDGGAAIDGYNVYRAVDSSMSGMTQLNTSLVTTTSYVDSGLGGGAHYWYTVIANNSIGESVASSATEGWTFDVPGAVTTAVAVEGDRQVGLTWNVSFGDPQHLSVVSYNIWRGTSAGGEDTSTPVNGAPVTGLSFSDTTAVNGTPYFYRVTAVNEVGQTTVVSGNEVQATPHVTVIVPTITHLVPANEAFVDNARPVISAEYGDTGSSINVTSVKLLLDSIDVTSQAVVTASSISYVPAIDLAKSVHSVQLDVSNSAATPMNTRATWTFTVRDYNIYFGGMHSHTNYSDGTGTPQQAYDTAKAAGVDFMAVTDHSNWFDGDSATVVANLAGGPSTEWASLKSIADTNNAPGTFVAIAGYEMTWSGGPGHINTFNTVGYDTRTHKTMDLTAYYAQLAQYPQSISQFNHPGTTFGTFDDFSHWTAEADAVVDLVEVGNGEGLVHQAGYFPSYQYYQMALDKGWHVAPSNNQDNHKGNWMASNDARTVVLAPELTRDAIYEAIRQKRVYATEDKDLRVTYNVNGAVMGSSLDNPATLDFHITFGDAEATDIITKVSIIANGGVVVASTNPNTNEGTWNYTLSTDPYSFYYVRIDQADTDVAVTAPVWTGDVVKVGLSKVEASQDPQIVGSPVDFTATAYNNSPVPVTNATMEFFKDTMVPENKLGEVAVPSIAASGSTTATLTWTPTIDGTWTIYARLTAMVDAQQKTFSASTSFTAANAEDVTKVVIDGGHYNAYTTGYYAGSMKTLTALIKTKKMMPVTTALDHELTAADLQYASILILNDPQSKPLPPKNYTAAEIQLIKDFVAAGGSLILTSRADYDELAVKADLTAHSAYQGNVVLDAIGSNLRLNDDEVVDNTSNGGQAYRLYFDDYTGSKYHLTDNILAGETYSFYSGCSVILKTGGSDAQVDWLVKGHTTTASLDADLANDAVPVAQGNVYALAAEVLPGGGKVVVAGTAFFSDFETASTDNAYSDLQITSSIIDWAAALPLAPLMTVAEARADVNSDGVPDLLGTRVAVEGRVTAQSKAVGPNTAFFDVIYVQDATGGLTIFGISNSTIPLGALVRVTGVISQFEGDSQIHVLNESDDITIVDSVPALVSPVSMSTGGAMLESSEGWLVSVQGVVMSIATTGGDNSLYIDDGTGISKVYVNGYVGDGTSNPSMLGAWDPAITVGDWISAIGLASQDVAGHRLRVRNTAEIVRPPFSPVQITTPSPLPTGLVGTPYSQVLSAEGGDGMNYAWSLNSGMLPPGLALDLPSPGPNSTAAALQGTPTTPGIYNFNVKVVSAGHAAFKDFSFVVVPATYQITPSAGEGGTISPSTAQDCAYGSSAVFTITPNTGYHIVDVLVDSVSFGRVSSYIFTNVQADHAIQASFAINPYTVTFDKNRGTTEASPTSATTTLGGIVALPVPPTRTGYTFAGWNTKSNGKGATFDGTTKVTGNITIYADWARNFTVTFDKNRGTTEANPKTRRADYNTTVMLPAPPTRTGYNFASWNTKSNGKGTTFDGTTKVTGNITVYAKWTRN